MHAAIIGRAENRSHSGPITSEAASPATVCGRKLTAASVALRPCSPSREIWWNPSAVASIPVAPAPAVITQNSGVRSAHPTPAREPSPGAPGRCRTGGLPRSPKTAIGSSTTQIATPCAVQAARQPNSAIRCSVSTGVSEIPMPPTAVLIPEAVPRRRSNQSATAVVATRVSAPCPASRTATYPNVRPSPTTGRPAPRRNRPR